METFFNIVLFQPPSFVLIYVCYKPSNIVLKLLLYKISYKLGEQRRILYL